MRYRKVVFVIFVGLIVSISTAQAQGQSELHLVGSTGQDTWHTIRHTDSWEPFGNVENQAGEKGIFDALASASTDGELHLIGGTFENSETDGHLWHTIRYSDGTWDPFGDVEGQAGEKGKFNTISTAMVAGELHVVGGTTDGHLWHTIRYSDGTWDPFGDVEKQAGDKAYFDAIAIASVAGELHVVGCTGAGDVWHTIRRANGVWEPFGDVKGQAGDRGVFRRMAAASVADELHVVGSTLIGGNVWHTIRHADGAWEPFGDVKGQAGNKGYFNVVAAAGVADELHLVGGTSDGHLWHTIRHTDWTWEPFRDVEKHSGDQGNFAATTTSAVSIQKVIKVYLPIIMCR